MMISMVVSLAATLGSLFFISITTGYTTKVLLIKNSVYPRIRKFFLGMGGVLLASSTVIYCVNAVYFFIYLFCFLKAISLPSSTTSGRLFETRLGELMKSLPN